MARMTAVEEGMRQVATFTMPFTPTPLNGIPSPKEWSSPLHAMMMQQQMSQATFANQCGFPMMGLPNCPNGPFIPVKPFGGAPGQTVGNEGYAPEHEDSQFFDMWSIVISGDTKTHGYGWMTTRVIAIPTVVISMVISKEEYRKQDISKVGLNPDENFEDKSLKAWHKALDKGPAPIEDSGDCIRETASHHPISNQQGWQKSSSGGCV